MAYGAVVAGSGVVVVNKGCAKATIDQASRKSTNSSRELLANYRTMNMAARLKPTCDRWDTPMQPTTQEERNYLVLNNTMTQL
jgi:hypothetical protein